MCDAAGYKGPLHACSIAGNKAADRVAQGRAALVATIVEHIAPLGIDQAAMHMHAAAGAVEIGLGHEAGGESMLRRHRLDDAAKQDGVVARRQVLALGGSASDVRRRLRRYARSSDQHREVIGDAAEFGAVAIFIAMVLVWADVLPVTRAMSDAARARFVATTDGPTERRRDQDRACGQPLPLYGLSKHR